MKAEEALHGIATGGDLARSPDFDRRARGKLRNHERLPIDVYGRVVGAVLHADVHRHAVASLELVTAAGSAALRTVNLWEEEERGGRRASVHAIDVGLESAAATHVAQIFESAAVTQVCLGTGSWHSSAFVGTSGIDGEQVQMVEEGEREEGERGEPAPDCEARPGLFPVKWFRVDHLQHEARRRDGVAKRTDRGPHTRTHPLQIRCSKMK